MSMSNTLGKLIAEVRAEKGLDMKDKLEYLIQKAIEGKWDKPKHGYKVWEPISSLEPLIVLYEDYDTQIQYNYQAVIFDHKFAKALFGEEIWVRLSAGLFEEEVKPDRAFMPSIHKPLWQHHLQQAVINEDSITYLYNAVKALEGEKK